MLQNIIRKSNIVSLCALLFLLAFSKAQATEKINWAKNYQEAVDGAKASHKPIFLYFSGSDWCSWCMKMDKEILEDEAFVHALSSKFIFLQVDFPSSIVQEPAIAKENEFLKEKFQVRGFPTIILLDSSIKPFATLQYRPGGGQEFAAHVLKLYERHSSYEKDIQQMEKLPLARLEGCFIYAQELKDKETQKALVSLANKTTISSFFLKEKYRLLLEENKIATEEAQSTRKMLLAQDPNNEKRIAYEVAVLDFEALSKNSATLDAETIVRPLKDYLTAFGADDEKNRWKVEVMISQTYSNKNLHEEALNFALASQNHAPACQRLDIAQNIADIQEKFDEIANQDDDK